MKTVSVRERKRRGRERWASPRPRAPVVENEQVIRCVDCDKNIPARSVRPGTPRCPRCRDRFITEPPSGSSKLNIVLPFRAPPSPEALAAAAAERAATAAEVKERREAQCQREWAEYEQGEKVFGERLVAAARRARSPFHKPPTDDAARRWMLAEMFGSRERAARMLGVPESAVRKAYDRIDGMVRRTPGLRDLIDDILDEADRWREAQGSAGSVTQYTRMGVDPSALVRTYSARGEIEVRTARRSLKTRPLVKGDTKARDWVSYQDWRAERRVDQAE